MASRSNHHVRFRTSCLNPFCNRFMLRFEVQDPTSSAVFVALDSEFKKIVQAGASDVIMMGEAEGKARVVASFDGLLGVEKDYQTTTTAFNMKIKTSPSFTVSKLPHKPGDQRQQERTGRNGSPRLQYLQELVSEFQHATNEETKEKVVAHLANFAYDPFNFTFLRQLNVLDLFLDCLTEPNEKLVEFGVGGICNACVDAANAALISQCGGIPLVVQCLSNPVRNTVNYALGALYYLCNPVNKEEILKPEVVEVIERYASAGAVSVIFSNLAKAFLEKHSPGQT